MHEVSSGVRSTRSNSNNKDKDKDDDGGIVLDIDRGQMFRLNPVGALILEALKKGCAEMDIAQEIARQYGISENTAIGDVRGFIKSLEEHMLVRPQ